MVERSGNNGIRPRGQALSMLSGMEGVGVIMVIFTRRMKKNRKDRDELLCGNRSKRALITCNYSYDINI
jgi:hypothetical protein